MDRSFDGRHSNLLLPSLSRCLHWFTFLVAILFSSIAISSNASNDVAKVDDLKRRAESDPVAMTQLGYAYAA